MRALLPTLFCALCLPAIGGETEWLEVAPDVSVRLISSGEVRTDGRTLVGLEIDMPATTKTYWYVPGETGIPTVLDLSGSRGIAAHEVHWPYPTIEQSAGYLDFVYYGRTVLPVELVLEGGVAELDLTAVMGICAEICVPVKASFSLPLGAEPPDPGNALRLLQAMAETPLDWRASFQPIGSVRFDVARQALAVELEGTEIDPRSLLGAIEGGRPMLGMARPDGSGDGVLLPLIGRTPPTGLAGRSVDFVFLTEDGPYRLTRAIEPE